MATTLLSPEVKQQIVLSAYAAVGPGAPDSPFEVPEQIRQKVVELTIAAQDAVNDRSPLAQAMAQIEQSSPFVGIILGGTKDPRNSRVHIRFTAENGPGQNAAEDGSETITTEPDYYPSGAAMIAKAKTLKGHRVLIYKHVEAFTSADNKPGKMKVCRALVDLGMPKEKS